MVDLQEKLRITPLSTTLLHINTIIKPQLNQYPHLLGSLSAERQLFIRADGRTEDEAEKGDPPTPTSPPLVCY